MNVAIVTGSGGLIGSEAVTYFSGEFDLVVGLDNDMRAVFFGPEASTAWNARKLCEAFPNYRHCEIDIRDDAAVQRVMAEYGKDISLIIHAAAQPSHDWRPGVYFPPSVLTNTGPLFPAAAMSLCPWSSMALCTMSCPNRA